MMNKLPAYLRIGLYLGAAEIAYGLFFRGVGFHHTSRWSWVFYLMLPVAAWLAQTSTRTQKGRLGFPAAALAGSVAVGIGSIIYCVQVWLYNRFVSDSLLVEVRAARLHELQEAGRSAAEIATATQSLDSFLQPAAFAVAVCVQLMIVGVVVSLVTGVFTRRSS